MSITEHPHYTRKVWRIEGGQVAELDVHATVSEAPPSVIVGFASGLVRRDREAWCTAQAAAILARSAPWAVAYVAPRFCVLGAEGRSIEPWGYAIGPSLMLLRSELRPDAYAETVHHEVWHLCSEVLPARAVAAVDAEVGIGDRWNGDRYLDEPDERRARAYARYCALADEGFLHARRPGSAAAVFQGVYAGDLARAIRRRTAT